MLRENDSTGDSGQKRGEAECGRREVREDKMAMRDNGRRRQETKERKGT